MTKVDLLAISSGGGHWEQMTLLRPAFEGCQVLYAVTERALIDAEVGADIVLVPDFNQHRILDTLKGSIEVVALVIQTRPKVIVSTGAAPGLIALISGRLLGAKTIWIDSVANAEQLSLSGRLARFFSSRWITQWEHLALPGGPEYFGSVL